MNEDRKNRSGISPEDRALWEQITKDVRPLEGRPKAPPLPKNRSRGLRSSGSVAAYGPAMDMPVGTGKAAPVGRVDRKSRRRLSRGRMQIDSTVDLHGMTQTQALLRLRRHLQAATVRGERTVLVITGKGGKRTPQLNADPVQFRRRDSFDLGSGVLRRMVPLWLESVDLSPIVHAYGPAAEGHGGDGALYVLLRRS